MFAALSRHLEILCRSRVDFLRFLMREGGKAIEGNRKLLSLESKEDKES